MTSIEDDKSLQMPLQDILLATNGFANKNLIAKGGFGNVYKGISEEHGCIAVKQLDRGQGQGDHEFKTEIALLSEYKHENIVSLVGFCDEDGEKILYALPIWTLAFLSPILVAHKDILIQSTVNKPERAKKEAKPAAGDEKKRKGSLRPPPSPSPRPQEFVFSVFMHCEDCARKVRRCLKDFAGVEGVVTDCYTHKVVVKGEKADPVKVLERIKNETHRQVELLSPDPKRSADQEGPSKRKDKKDEKGKKTGEGKKEEKEATPTVGDEKIKAHKHVSKVPTKEPNKSNRKVQQYLKGEGVEMFLWIVKLKRS
ncbi:hypothetical protein L1987_79362 [Smallanthus sonchifolius]|uniref:Uncharacterized protein n=1 Tax=Smallanthus sonchifolius TaxID=185202 RepID=A0ACB8ZG97_9ASTR|nr:hypothetical protein L1987_79362 [Smallanthus sonchifolius]